MYLGATGPTNEWEPEASGSCCSQCAQTGGSCSDNQPPVPRMKLAPPMLMQGPWDGVRLDYGINNYDYMIPQAGTLMPVNTPPEMWEYELSMKEQTWQG